MLKPITVLAVASILFTGASAAQADDRRYDRRGHSHHAQHRHGDYAYLTRAERRDLRRLQRYDRRDLSRSERRYLRRLIKRAKRQELLNQRQYRDRRFYHHRRGDYCRLRNRHYHGERAFYGTLQAYLAAEVAHELVREAFRLIDRRSA